MSTGTTMAAMTLKRRPRNAGGHCFPNGKLAIEWITRGALAFLAALVGLASVSITLANFLVKGDPSQAHLLAPMDGNITAALAQQTFALAPTADADSEASYLARRALIQNPTAADALNVLGFQAQLRNDTGQTRRIFGYSLALSRRELEPRLWAIEEAIDRGDIIAALVNYDIALRTSSRAEALLFPTLAKAVAEPKVRAALIELLARRPVWERKFVNFLASGAGDPLATVRFFNEGKRIKLPVLDRDRASVVNSLVQIGSYREAWNYYASFRRANPAISRDPEFSLVAEVSAPFDWVAINDGTLSTAILPNETGGVVDFAAPSSVGGVVLKQMQMLPAGTYRLEGRSSGIEQPQRSLPYWSLTCTNGRELGRIIVPRSGQASSVFTGLFRVPGNCPVQTLALIVRPSDEVGGVTGKIERALLEPEQG